MKRIPWLLWPIDFKYILTPIAISNIRFGDGIHADIGYTIIWIFGIKVFVFQRTKPWE